MLRALFFSALALPAALIAQAQVATTASVAASPATSSATNGAATAVRAASAPVLDGKGDDAAWAAAPEISAFRQFEPVEDGNPSYATTAKIAFDERYLYVLLRADDPEPHRIIGQLSRRDRDTPSDWLVVMVDSYHDRRTGYEFFVNPAGVKRDATIINDGEEDTSWDGIWDVATARDARGWSAEFRIPLSQLRFPPNGSPTFGMLFARVVGRTKEGMSWPLYRRSKGGLPSQFAQVSGFAGLSSPRRLEVTPYTVVKNVEQRQLDGSGATAGYDRAQLGTFGADIKYGVTSNLTLDATINPDFGQVEADPAQLNLSAFETFYSERRPFFMEGAGLFRFDVNCNDGACSGLFYSRRIGRSPQLNGVAQNEDPTASVSTSTPILGAAKLTGRAASGLQVGLLNAVTGERFARGRTIDAVTEPRTNYFVGRVAQDYRKGNSTIGVMGTAVNRSLDDFSEPWLRRSAYSAGVDTRHRFSKERYEVSGWVAASSVSGSREAIALTQTSSAHYYQRPDGKLSFDPERTRLTGDGELLSIAKIGGGITRFQTTFRRLSPGFEINDIGYLQRADEQSISNWVGFQFNKPTKLYRMARLNLNNWQNWNTSGLLTELGGNVNGHIQFPSQAWLHVGTTANSLLASYDDRASRGGPAVRNSPGHSFWIGLEGDSRKRISPSAFFATMRSDEGRTHGFIVDGSLDLRLSDQLRMSAGPMYQHDIMDSKWFGRRDERDVVTGETIVPHYTFARLDQETFMMSVRMDYTMTPDLSLQLYARPYITGGEYSDWRELADPRADDYSERYRPFAPAEGSVADGNFNYKSLNTNAVLRWEYRPGSSLFVVWQQGRDQFLGGSDYQPFRMRRDTRGVLGVHPENTFLVKASYWLSL